MIKSKRGGVLTAVVGLIIFLLVLVSPQVKSTQTPDQLLKYLSPPLARMIWASICTARRIMRFKWIQMSKRIFS